MNIIECSLIIVIHKKSSQQKALTLLQHRICNYAEKQLSFLLHFTSFYLATKMKNTNVKNSKKKAIFG